MRSPLFWKIFLSFWMTTVVISQSSWFLYTLLWDPRPSWERETSERIAPVELAAARASFVTGGHAGFSRLRENLPDRGASLRVVPPGGKIDRANDRVARATGPHGEAVVLAYRLARDEPYSFDLLDTLARSYDFFLAAGLGGIVFAGLLAYYMMRPIRRLRDGFDTLARGDLSVRLGPEMGSRRDELTDLARHFDHMAGRLEQLVTVRDQLLHDVSHELRSPLARLNLAIALVRRRPTDPEPPLKRIEEEVARLDELVAELLSLARSESGSASHEDYFDLAGLLASVVSTVEVEAIAAGVTLDVDTSIGECIIRGSAELMLRAIENVLRNAIRESASGDTVRVRLTTAGETAEIAIGDQGPGVPAAMLKAIFEPFQRGAGAKRDRGYGLGLTIARRAILSHAGTIAARNLAPHGLEVTIRLPIATTSSSE